MSLTKSSLIYTVGKILPQAVGFILLPIYTKYLTSDEYGLTESMYMLIMVLSIFFSLGSERSLYRLYYDYDINEKKIFIGNVSILIFLISFIGTVFCFIFSDTLSLVFKSIPFNPYFTYSILTAFLMSFSLIPLTLLQIEEKAILFLKLSTSSFLLIVLFSLYFLLVEKEGAEGLVKGRFYGNLLIAPIYLYFVIKQSQFQPNKQMIKNIVLFSSPMIPILLTTWILNLSNRIFLEHFLTLSEVGIYSLAFKVSSLATIIPAAIFTAFSPIFYKYSNSNNTVLGNNKIQRLISIISYITIAVCFIVSIFSKEILLLFFNENYKDAIELVPMLVLSAFLISISGFYNLMIYQDKKPKVIMNISILGAIISIISNYLLIPFLGIQGAAIATVITSSTIFILKYLYAKRNYTINLPILIISFCIFFFAIFTIIDLQNSMEPKYSLLVKVLVVLFLFVIYYKKVKNIITSLN